MSNSRVGLLGYGTVGKAVHANFPPSDSGFELTAIGVRNPDRFSGGQFTSNLESVVQNCDILIEVMGGMDPAQSLILAALADGKPVITANKMLVASQWPIFRRFGDLLHCEAAVAAAIPVVSTLKNLVKVNRIDRIEGILNGTTNYILQQMLVDDFDSALRRAQELGYAEADPTSDVDGWDSAYKIAILAGIVTGQATDVATMRVEGIRSITADQVRSKTLKLIASWNPVGGACVEPKVLALEHPLANVNGTQNAVTITGFPCGPITLIGTGAGGDATSSAILLDLMSLSD